MLLANIVKFVFVCVQIVVLLLALGVIGFAIWLELQYRSLKQVLDSSTINYGPHFIICVGIIIFLIALFGIVVEVKGTRRPNVKKGRSLATRDYLGIYIIVAFVVLMGQTLGAMATFLFREQVESIARQGLNDSLKYYGRDSDAGTLVTDLWNNLQEENGCCGVNGASDWIGEIQNSSVAFPSTCCRNTTDLLCGHNTTSIASAYGGGCLSVVTEYLSSHLLYLGAFGLSVVAVQAVAIIIAVLILTFTDYSGSSASSPIKRQNVHQRTFTKHSKAKIKCQAKEREGGGGRGERLKT